MKRKIIRIHKKDSAFVYAILESLEGMVSYSTVEPSTDSNSSCKAGSLTRDLELHIPFDFLDEVDEVLEGMRKKFPVLEISILNENNGSKFDKKD